MLFTVKAARGDADILMLPIEAVDAPDAARVARDQGYAVLAVKRAGFNISSAARWHARFPVLLFTQELVALLEAGLNLVAAIETLAEKESSPTIRDVLGRILQSLYEGAPYSKAVEEFPQIFPTLYVATVRSNETTGGLVEALTRYVRYETQMELVRSKLVSAMIYPALLFAVGGGVTLFLLFYVVPRFRQIFEDMHTDLPLFSRLLVDWGGAVESHSFLVALAFVGVFAASVATVANPNLRTRLLAGIFEMPGVGTRFRTYQLARFYRALGMLQRSGIPLTRALEIAASLLSVALRPAMELAREAVRQGVSFSEAMESRGLTTSIAYRLLRVAEHSGNMPEMLDRIASFHEDELARWVDRFTRLFEPILMATIGIVIGMVVVFLYMPIFELAGSIQ